MSIEKRGRNRLGRGKSRAEMHIRGQTKPWPPVMLCWVDMAHQCFHRVTILFWLAQDFPYFSNVSWPHRSLGVLSKLGQLVTLALVLYWAPCLTESQAPKPRQTLKGFQAEAVRWTLGGSSCYNSREVHLWFSTGRRASVLPALEGLALTLSLLSLVYLLGLRINLAFEDIQTWI